ncbi:valine--tRNA ligase [Candidatus Riesia pediculischaeffi]|nr:valine--tRNA ligase [Candidatus Riesia pediculischaeffi]
MFEEIHEEILNKSYLLFEKNFSPEEIERLIYRFWEISGFLRDKGYKNDKEVFCTVSPPPNITGRLHIGHALQYTIIDMLIRYHYMNGKHTLWKGGVDHAGIAAQIVVEKYIFDRYGKNKIEFGRKKFIEKIWDWKEEMVQIMHIQMQYLGNLVSLNQSKFTMDRDVSEAVTEAFVRLYEDRIIYRGKRLVNWDPKLKTVISDLEVKTVESKKTMWYIRYPIIDPYENLENQAYVVVATSSPETIFGDSAVAVHPEDEDKKHLIGMNVLLPIVGRKIPIISDRFVDMKKGTGYVRITPAHSFQDYEVAMNHDLPIVEVLNRDGSMRRIANIFYKTGRKISDEFDIPSFFCGKRDLCLREGILKSLNHMKLLIGKERYVSRVNYNERSKSEIYPILTDQWFINVKNLKEEAISVVRDKKIKFFPKKYEKIYFSWMNQMKDWCISRQLLWGHRIPVWYDDDGRTYVGRNEREIRKRYNLCGTVLKQDQDVLDTWFSSSLWTFVVFGWPKRNNKDLSVFHPTDVLVSGFDIIFFWISRMIMMTLYFIKNEDGSGQVPFKKVYITGLVCDEDGKKMSKSRGNMIDPILIMQDRSYLEKISKFMFDSKNILHDERLSDIGSSQKIKESGQIRFGADSLRLTLASLSSGNRKILLDKNQIVGYQNFCNKVWHASRFVLNNITIHGEIENDQFPSKDDKIFSLDRWIVFEFKKMVSRYRAAFERFRFDMVSSILYGFVWNQFCDWYLELSKISIRDTDMDRKISAEKTLLMILEGLLKLSHPIVPFVSEFVWQNINRIKNRELSSILEEPFPVGIREDDLKEEKNRIAYFEVETIKRFIVFIRNLRSQFRSCEEKILKIIIFRFLELRTREIVRRYLKHICKMTGIPIIIDCNKQYRSKKSFEGLLDFTFSTVNLNKSGDIQKNIRNKIEQLDKEITVIQKDLKNPHFLAKAPKKVIEEKMRRVKDLEDAKKSLVSNTD